MRSSRAALPTMLAALALGWQCRRADDDPGANAALRQLQHERLDGQHVPREFGASHAAVVVLDSARAEPRQYVLDDDSHARVPADGLIALVTILAALRAGVINPNTPFRCTGQHCARAHGAVDASHALAVGCEDYVTDVARRLSGEMLAPAFAQLDVVAPPIPRDAPSVEALGARGEGWTLTPEDALPLARAMFAHPAPWFPSLSAGAIPSATGDALEGLATGRGNDRAWFVGFERGAAPRFVAAHVGACVGECEPIARRVADWALRRAGAP